MGFLTGTFPGVDPDSFMKKPYRECTKILSRFWIENGFGSPKSIMVMYLAKLDVFFVGGGILVGTLTSHLSPLYPSQCPGRDGCP
jgi:hypothetical protein